MTSTSPRKQWNSIADNDLTVDDVRECLGSICDDLWVAAACADRLANDIPVQRALLEYGIERTANAVALCKDYLIHSQEVNESVRIPSSNALVEHFRDVPRHAHLCHLRAVLFERLNRLTTFVEICARISQTDEVAEVLDEWEDDPWAAGTDEPPSAMPKSATVELPFTLPKFLTEDLVYTSCLLAARSYVSALNIVRERYSHAIWPYRFDILASIPGHVPPTEYLSFLPALDSSNNAERDWTSSFSGSELDWSETFEAQRALKASGIDLHTFMVPTPIDYHPRPDPLTNTELSKWYRDHVDRILSSTGMVNIALATIQHGASHDVHGLDELGEELSLLSRLVYDAPRSEDEDDMNDWSLTHWKAMDPGSVVRTYLAHSTSNSIAEDILRLVMPYLYVLESRAERAGNPDPSLHTHLLYNYILTAPLNLAAAIFEASKPTLSPGQRLIKSEEDTARLALACLYGSDHVDEWNIMSSIFECLPAWDTPKGEELDGDVADTTVASLGKYVAPTTARPLISASDLLVFFNPLPKSSLSRALDILDVHLMSGEILARWGVPAPLRWFLQSSEDLLEQKARANKMARRTGSTDDRLDTIEDWDWLLEDMLKLSDPGTGESGIKGAFGLLTRREVINIFFSGLLSTGKFHIAKQLLYSSKLELSLDAETIEGICLACSREFYDNASSANYKFGDMKKAYDCLDVPKQSDRLQREKDFIEATSRLSSFNIVSRPGIPISPIEIRLTKDRLSLISRVISSNADAFKHTEVILDLTYKLGFRNDPVAQVKVLAMLADTALQVEDFSRAYDTSKRMIDAVLALRSSSPLAVAESMDPIVQQVSDVCWVACFQLGRHPEFDNVDQKLALLGRALEFCPPDKLHEVLAVWRRLEKEDIENRCQQLLPDRPNGTTHRKSTSAKKQRSSSSIDSLATRLQNFRMSPLSTTPDAAALASRTLQTVAANFPFGRDPVHEQGTIGVKGSKGRLMGSGADDVSAQASRVLSKGIGWLMGEDL